MFTRDDVTVINTCLNDFRGVAWLIELDGLHFVVSGVDAPHHGPETIIFLANEYGRVINWTSLVELSSVDHELAIDDFISKVNEIISLRGIENNIALALES